MTNSDNAAPSAKANEVERDLDEMQERADHLGDEIEGAGEDWEHRKADDKVPGATGDPDEGDDDDAGGDDGEELDFGRSLAEDDGGDDEEER